MACLIFHKWVGIEHTATHFWYTNKTAKWYEYSIGEAVCIHCGKKKEKHKFTLLYLPKEGNHANI